MEHPGHGDLPEEGLRQADHEPEADRDDGHVHRVVEGVLVVGLDAREAEHQRRALEDLLQERRGEDADRKSTRLNSSHGYISYAVFCLKKKSESFAQWLRNLATP